MAGLSTTDQEVGIMNRSLIGTVILTLLSASALFSQQAPGQQAPGRGQQGPRVVSPEVLADKTVTFRLLAPKAEAVILIGSWENGASIPMIKDDQGIWSVKVGPLGEQLWWYAFSVDGIRVLDPGNGEVSRDGAKYDNWQIGRAHV